MCGFCVTDVDVVFADEKLTFITVCVHLFNSIYIVTDMFITAIPFRILHLWLPEIFGISYTIYSLLHWTFTQAESVYYVLDYEDSPGLSAIYLLLVAFVASPLFHCLTFCIYWLRVIVYSKCCGRDDQTRDVQMSPKGDKRMDDKTSEEAEQFSVEEV